VVIVRAITLNVVTAAFTPLKLGSVVMLTVLGVLAAAGMPVAEHCLQAADSYVLARRAVRPRAVVHP
jgi:hypothetical protein